MTTANPTAPAADASPRVMSVSLCLGGELFTYGLFWSGIVLGFLILNITANGVFGTVDATMWGDGGILTRYLFDLAGVMVVVSCLPMYLTYGITRREFVAGAVPAGLALAFAAALAATLVFLLEGLLFQLADWPHVLGGGGSSHLYDRPDEFGVILLEWFVVYGTHLLTGMLIGASFLRFGPVFGALLLPFTALPAVGAEMALGAGGAGAALNEALDLTPPHAGVGLLITLGLAVAAVGGVRWLTRDIAIDNQRVVWWR